MMLAAIALLIVQSPADQHRLTWVKQADGSMVTRHHVGDAALLARCRTGRPIRCIVVRRMGDVHIAVRRLTLDRLPMFTVGLSADPAGYGCDWIAPTRVIAEAIRDRNGRILSRKLSTAAQQGWPRERIGAQYFGCVPILRQALDAGLDAMPFPAID